MPIWRYGSANGVSCKTSTSMDAMMAPCRSIQLRPAVEQRKTCHSAHKLCACAFSLASWSSLHHTVHVTMERLVFFRSLPSNGDHSPFSTTELNISTIHEIIVYSTPAKEVNQERRKKDTSCIRWTYSLTQQQTRTGTQ